MIKVPANIRKQLLPDGFPRSAKYDPEWVMKNAMGPQPLWLAESLSKVMHLKPGMKVLDLGCGKALTSIFLAKEFKVEVWAAELWIKADENQKRISEAGLKESVHPLEAEALKLPFDKDFFDAMVSFDAYHYFGTDPTYLDYYQQFARPGGEIGFISPGLTHELKEVPAKLKPYWMWDDNSFHSPEWWTQLWQKNDNIEIKVADLVPNGHILWREWNESFLALKIGDQDVIGKETKGSQ